MSSVVGNDLSGITLDNRYSLLEPLGEGAMGQVYIAHHEALDRSVAVKVLHPWLASEPRHRRRFMREARAASRIKHPNVVAILDVGTTPNDSIYLVMELLKGRDLKALLEQEGPLSWERARHFLLQATAALQEAHRQDVIHRDIKPANCFVCTPPEPGMPEHMKLLDFGIAKLEDPGASQTGPTGKRLTQTGELVGTLAYMAPEFADGKPASVHTDMYALGIMAYELITGNVPFTGRNEFQVLARHLNEPPVRPRVLVPELPDAAESVLLTLLAKKPELRFETMADVEQALLAIPGDARADGPVVVPRGRRESSASRDAAPPVGRIRQLTPAQIVGEEPAPKPEPSATPFASSDSRDQWTFGEPFDFDAGSDEDDDDLEPPGVEWGTVATVILLVLLSAAAIASVVLRQQGIELHELWPWGSATSESEATPTEVPDAGPASGGSASS